MTAQETFDNARAAFAEAWAQNQCGDATCETRRLNAALAVLRGTDTHVRLATRIEDELAAFAASEMKQVSALPTERAEE